MIVDLTYIFDNCNNLGCINFKNLKTGCPLDEIADHYRDLKTSCLLTLLLVHSNRAIVMFVSFVKYLYNKHKETKINNENSEPNEKIENEKKVEIVEIEEKIVKPDNIENLSKETTHSQYYWCMIRLFQLIILPPIFLIILSPYLIILLFTFVFLYSTTHIIEMGYCFTHYLFIATCCCCGAGKEQFKKLFPGMENDFLVPGDKNDEQKITQEN